MPIKDIAGQKFGRWTVISFAGTKNENAYWNCICDCGEKRVVKGGHMRMGLSVSCGCYHADNHTTHGYASKKSGNLDQLRAYKAYNSMLRRVAPDSKDANNYFNRGITITDQRWIASVENFMQDMGPCPAGMSLDRIDNDKGYSKDNCRWATNSEQSTNKRGARVSPELFGRIKKEIAAGSNDTCIAIKYDLKRSTVARIRHNKVIYCSRPEYQGAING